MGKLDQDHEILGRQAALRATAALTLYMHRRKGRECLGVGIMRTCITGASPSRCKRERPVSLWLATACFWPSALSMMRPDCMTFHWAQDAPAGRTAGVNTSPGAILNTGICDLQTVTVKISVTEMNHCSLLSQSASINTPSQVITSASEHASRHWPFSPPCQANSPNHTVLSLGRWAFVWYQWFGTMANVNMRFTSTVITVTPNECNVDSASRVYGKGKHATLKEDGNVGSIVPESAGAEADFQGAGVAIVTWFAGEGSRKMQGTLVMMDNIWGPL